MLRRLGNKSKLLPKLLPLFPENITTFIDMFMGSGAVTFAMVDRAKYVIANDNDEEVFNLFMVVKEHKQALVKTFEVMPLHEQLFQHWKQEQESDGIWKATRFLMLSNCSLYGKCDTLRIGERNDKTSVLANIGKCFEFIQNVQFLHSDFRDVLTKVEWRENTKEKS